MIKSYSVVAKQPEEEICYLYKGLPYFEAMAKYLSVTCEEQWEFAALVDETTGEIIENCNPFELRQENYEFYFNKR